MPGPTTEILNDDIKALRSDVQRIEVGLAEIRSEFRTAFRFASGLIKLLLVTTLAGIAASIWWAGTITAEVKNLGTRVGQVETRLERVEVEVTGIKRTIDG